jgi:hypothetical protein
MTNPCRDGNAMPAAAEASALASTKRGLFSERDQESTLEGEESLGRGVRAVQLASTSRPEWPAGGGHIEHSPPGPGRESPGARPTPSLIAGKTGLRGGRRRCR